MKQQIDVHYDLGECAPEFASLLATLLFRLSDAGGYANLDSEALEALGKLITALLATKQRSI